MNFSQKTLTLSILLCLFSFNSVFALTSTSTSQRGTVVATVGINNAKIASQDKRNFTLSFNLSNGAGAQPQVKYAVRLTKATINGEFTADEKLYAETLSLSENSTTTRTINYIIPEQLSAGTYRLFIDVKNENGLMLALAFLGDINITENISNTVEIVPDSCRLIADANHYLSGQSASIGSSSKLTATCAVKSSFSTDVVLSPNFITRIHSIFGDIASTTGGTKENITIKKGDNNILLDLPIAIQPQDYVVTLFLANNGKTISNDVTFNYSISGARGTIQNVVFDKTSYMRGENANLQIFSTQTSTGTMTIIVSDNSGNCSATTSKQISSFSIINFPISIIKDCTNPQANITISDENGNTLDSKDFKITSGALSATEIIFILLLIILASILGYLIYKKKYSAMKVFIFILIGLSGLFRAGEVYASPSCHVVWGSCGTQNFTVVVSGVYSPSYNLYYSVENWITNKYYDCKLGSNGNCSPDYNFGSNSVSVKFWKGSAYGAHDIGLVCDVFSGSNPQPTCPPSPPSPVPSAAISASPASVYSGSASTISWNSSNVTYCTIYKNGYWFSSGTSGSANSGSLTGGSSQTTYRFTISCSGSYGGASDGVSVTVYPTPPTVTLRTTSDPIPYGSSATLYWTSTNSNFCTLTGNNQNISWSTNYNNDGGTLSSGNLTSNTAYSLSCTGNGGTVTSPSVVVSVLPPLSVNISASPAGPIAAGASTTISWSANSVASCTITKNGSPWKNGNPNSFVYFYQFGGFIPTGITLDSSGNIYVSDLNSNSILIRDLLGNYSSIGSSGSGLGQFIGPYEMSLNPSSLYVVDSGNNRVQRINSSGYLSFGSYGALPGQFDHPYGIVVDSSANKYVTDANNNRVEKFDSNNIFKWWLGYNGSTIGTHTTGTGVSGTGNGQFNGPKGIALDSSGNIYVADYGNSRIQKFDSAGNFVWWLGFNGVTAGTHTTGTSISGSVLNGQFNGPRGIALDSFDNIYVSDSNNNRIQIFDSSGNFVSKFGTLGSGNGQLNTPRGITLDSSGNIYVSDTGNNRVQKFSRINISNTSANSGALTTNTTFTISCTGLSGETASKSVTVATVSSPVVTISATPSSIPYNSSTNISWSATNANSCSVTESGDASWTKNSISGTNVSSGILSTTTTFTATCTGTGGTSNNSVTVSVASASSPAVTISASSTLVSPGASTTVSWKATNANSCSVTKTGDSSWTKTSTSPSYLSQFGSKGSGNGQFLDPFGIAFDSVGNKYVVDFANNRVQKFDSSDNFVWWLGYDGSTIGTHTAGTGVTGTGNGQFKFPAGIALDSLNNIYVVDGYNHRVQKFDSAGNFVWWLGYDGSTIGTHTTGVSQYGSGPGQFKYPEGITLDSSGNIYVADYGNSRIQKFTSSGANLFQSGSSNAFGITLDSSGNIYVTNYGLGSIQKFTSSGAYLSQFGSSGSGDGQFTYPQGITLDSANPPNIYMVDTGNNRVQKFKPSGFTYIYDSQFGVLGSGNGQFDHPYGIALDSSGNIYISDAYNHRVQKFSPNINVSANSGIITANTTFTATCTGAGGTVSNSVPVSVIGPHVDITASDSQVAPNASTNISWTSTDAGSCSITKNGNPFSTALSGSSVSSGNLSTTTTFTASCTGSGGSTASASKTVLISSPTANISAASNSVASNETTTISWNSTNADSCSITEGGNPWQSGTSGSAVSDFIAGNTAVTFTISCTGLGGSATDSTTVSSGQPSTNQHESFTCQPPTGTLYINTPTTWTIPTSHTVTGTDWSGTNISGTAHTSGTTLTKTYTTIGRKYIYATSTGPAGTAADPATYTATCSASAILQNPVGTTTEI